MVEACGAGFLECVEIVPGEDAFFAEMRRVAENWSAQQNWTKDTKSY
jgi:hypothetical protein